MQTEEKLNWLKLYFDTRRAVGHSYTMINGVKGNIDKCAVMVRHQAESRYLFSMAGAKFRTFSWDDPYGVEKLRGLKCALVIDNNAMISILGDALEEIRRLRAENVLLNSVVYGK
jgi:hypothetical protein